MKKVLLTLLVLLTVIDMYAQSSSIPDWVQNYRKAYPNTEYLVQRGSGDSAEKARTDATAALSRYFRTNVNANLSTTMSSVISGDYVEGNTIIVDDVSVQSQVEFFGLEYTEPYYLKSENKWYCVVYINRDDAWIQYQPQIDIKKNSFNGLYNKLEKETDYFTRIGMCKKVWKSGEELLEKLEYGRIINYREETAYQNERDKISNIPVIFDDARENCSVCIQINSDYDRTVETALSTVLTECGFRVAKTVTDANYIAEVKVSDNISGEEPLSIKPGVNLKILNKSEKTVFSYELISNEKTLSYTLEGAQKKAYPKFSKELEEAVKQNLNDFFKL